MSYRLKVARILTLIIMFGFACFCLHAQNTVSATPAVSFQHVIYTDNAYDSQDAIGPGLELSFDHFFNGNNNAVSLSLSYENFKFSDSNYQRYNNLKLTASFKHLLLQKRMVRLYWSVGGGADFVIREDLEKGLYPIVNAALILAVPVSDRLNINIKTCAAASFQNGSSVIHGFVGAGLCYSLKNSEKVAEI